MEHEEEQQEGRGDRPVAPTEPESLAAEPLEIAELRRQAEAAAAEAAALRAEREELGTLLAQAQAGAEAAQRQGAAARAAYRDYARHQNPQVPPELIEGETVEAIAASVARGQSLVQTVRRQALAELATQTPVPAGAPARAGGEAALEGMNPLEKISYALRTRVEGA